MLAAPESPTYLANKGKRDEAVAVATKLWGRSGASQLGAGEGRRMQRHCFSNTVQAVPLLAGHA
jgi:hypothetical protein